MDESSLIPNYGACLATHKITVDGCKIVYMFREAPNFDNDSGWRFFSGKETQAYVDDPENSGLYDVKTIASYDRAIVPYLHLPVGTELERVPNSNKFKIIKEFQ